MSAMEAEGLALAKANGRNPRLMVMAPRCLDEGRCCGRKPLRYQRPEPYLFCARCCAAYSLDGRQIANWAFRRVDDGFETSSWPSSETIAEQVAAGRIDPACVIREVRL